MDYFWSFFFCVDVDEEKQRKFVLDICTKIISHPYEQVNPSLSLGNHHYGRDMDQLLQKAFRSKNVNVTHQFYSNIYVGYEEDTLRDVLLINNTWIKPFIQRLKKLDKEKRKEWKQKCINSPHSVDEKKNHLINNIENILPSFKYLIDFEVFIIFGSEHGIYIIVETKNLDTNYGRSERLVKNVARNNFKIQAKKYKQFANEEFIVKVIEAFYINESFTIVDKQDRKIIRIINFQHVVGIWGLIYLNEMFLILTSALILVAIVTTCYTRGINGVFEIIDEITS
ncbi:5105_t:CDS:2, partial [Funneliformis mosseae]